MLVGVGRWETAGPDFLETPSLTDLAVSATFYPPELQFQALLGFSVPAATNTAPALSDLGGNRRNNPPTPTLAGERREREFICQARARTTGRTQFLIHFMMEIKFLPSPPSPLTIINTVANSSQSQATAAHLTE